MSNLAKSYKATVGCWNCDTVFDIFIKKGINTPEYLFQNNIPCKNCGCTTLRMYSEYLTRKEIMKDIMTHLEVIQIEQNAQIPPTRDHLHFG